MTELGPPATAAVGAALRPVEHPDMSDALAHFCDRARPAAAVPDMIRNMSAQDRLASILWEEQLRVHVTWSGGDPALCLTEATGAGLQFLINKRSYSPWGLIFQRQAVFDAGGAPVWYARPEEYLVLRELNPRLRSWAVRLEPGRSDWLEEREWRIPRPAGCTGVLLSELRPIALLVGDPSWWPARWHRDVWGPTGDHAVDFKPVVPRSAIAMPRLWWDGTKLQQLPPVG